MANGTSDTTVISPIKPEAHNPNTINASAASRDDASPATIPGNTPQKPSTLKPTRWLSPPCSQTPQTASLPSHLLSGVRIKQWMIIALNNPRDPWAGWRGDDVEPLTLIPLILIPHPDPYLCSFRACSTATVDTKRSDLSKAKGKRREGGAVEND